MAEKKTKTAVPETPVVFEGDLKKLYDFIKARTDEFTGAAPAVGAAPAPPKPKPMPFFDLQQFKTRGMNGIDTPIKKVVAHFVGVPDSEILGSADASTSKSERDARRVKFPMISGVCLIPLGKGHNYDKDKPVLSLGLCIKDAAIDVNGEDWDICLKPTGLIGNHIATSDVRVGTDAEIREFVMAWGAKRLPLIP